MLEDCDMTDKPLISFDYAIQYLLKNKGDHEIVEGFISVLLGTLGYPPVKINALLESASNKESDDLKKSVADLIVEDSKGVKYIVEIERSYTTNFMHKACFNSSRLISDNIFGAQDYRSIVKAFHISLLYFRPEEMQKPICHGKTIIHEVDEEPVDISIINQGNIRFQNKNIFPEYLFISVPAFNDIIRKEVDEWLYMLKNSDTKEDFKSPYMTKIKERLSVIKMSAKERSEYYKYLKDVIHAEDVLAAATSKGEAKGRAEERAARNIEIAKNMLSKKLDIKLISEITGLSEEDIRKLRS